MAGTLGDASAPPFGPPTDGRGGATNGEPGRVMCEVVHGGRGVGRIGRLGYRPSSKTPTMARLARLSLAGLPHLVEQSGHNGHPVATDAVDRAAYRDFLARAAAETGLSVHAYCIERARVLLLATPATDDALSRAIQRIGRSYTAWFNRRHGRSGTLWAGRFRATVIEPQSELVAAMRHVEADAALAGDASAAPAERVSSVAHHLGLLSDPLVSDHARFWELGNTPFDRHAAYRLLVMQPLADRERSRFDNAVRKGWALGPDAFLRDLEARLERRVRPRSPGRPRRQGSPAA